MMDYYSNFPAPSYEECKNMCKLQYDLCKLDCPNSKDSDISSNQSSSPSCNHVCKEEKYNCIQINCIKPQSSDSTKYSSSKQSSSTKQSSSEQSSSEYSKKKSTRKTRK